MLQGIKKGLRLKDIGGKSSVLCTAVKTLVYFKSFVVYKPFGCYISIHEKTL